MPCDKGNFPRDILGMRALLLSALTNDFCIEFHESVTLI